MANKIQLKRGLKSKLPTLSAGEPAYTTDTRELYIGTGSGNVSMGGSKWYTGTAMSGTSTTANGHAYSACPLVKLGDMYLNTAYGYVYECTTAGTNSNAKWTYRGCIRGAKGENASVTVENHVHTSDNPVSGSGVAKRVNKDRHNLLALIGILLSSANSTVKTQVKNFVQSKYSYAVNGYVESLTRRNVESFAIDGKYESDYIMYLPRDTDAPDNGMYDSVVDTDGMYWDAYSISGSQTLIYGDALIAFGEPVNGRGKAYVLYDWG